MDFEPGDLCSEIEPLPDSYAATASGFQAWAIQADSLQTPVASRISSAVGSLPDFKLRMSLHPKNEQSLIRIAGDNRNCHPANFRAVQPV
jgi:hypothetical protein